MKLHNTIIYLIGIPAVGKYTTAKAIARLTGAKVVDNQLINNPIFSVVGYNGKSSIPIPAGSWDQIAKIRTVVYEVIENLCPPEDSFVFTNVLGAKARGDRMWFRRLERVAKKRKARFVPVWLTCSEAALRQRKQRPDRKARLKDIDLTTIPFWVREFEVLRVNHPNALTLDTSNSSPSKTAKRIVAHAQRSGPK